MLDVFIDNTGVPAIIELGYTLTHREGRVVLVGVPRRGNTVNLYSLPLHFGKQLIGSQGGEALPQHDIPRYLRLQERGKLQLEQLVSAHYALEEINVAINAMRDGATAGRVMIRFDMPTIAAIGGCRSLAGLCSRLRPFQHHSSWPYSLPSPCPWSGRKAGGRPHRRQQNQLCL